MKDAVKLDTKSNSENGKLKKVAVRSQNGVKLIEKVEEEKKVPFHLVVKRGTRPQQKVDRNGYLNYFEPQKKEFPDQDVEFVEKSPKTFSSQIEILILLIGIPIYGLYLFIVCPGKECSFTKSPEEINFTPSDYFDLKSILAYLSSFLFLITLSAFPFGGWKVTALPDKNGKFVYFMNGLFTFLVFLTLSTTLEFFNIPVWEFIVDHMLHLYVAAVLTGFCYTVIMFVRSFYVPVSALSPKIANTNQLYHFVMGRELNPRIFGVIDLKMCAYKSLAISELMIDTALLYTSFQAIKNPEVAEEEFTKRLLRLSPTVLVFYSLQLIRLLEKLYYETSWVSTNELRKEAFGFDMGANYLIYPFISCYSLKYIMDQSVELGYWKLGLASAVFLGGQIVGRISDNSKDAFKKNVYSSKYSHLTTIPTNQGKKLLASGLWGFLRHPNYFGIVISDLAVVAFVGCAPPVIIRLFNVLYLINRARVDNAQCQRKYGRAWQQYCEKVPYLIIPNVY